MMATSSYYNGSTELATETPITVHRLEARRKLTKNSSRLVIALVGLPARGKSFVARKLLYYLNWSGAVCKIFNVGKYRRQAYAELQSHKQHQQQSSSERSQKGACDANFFDASNEEAARLREAVAEIALKDMLRWLDDEEDEEDENDDAVDVSRHSGVSTYSAKLNYKENERIAIFDATNSTDKRRQWILDLCTSPEKRPGKPTGVVFVESLCDDMELLEENYRYKINNSPDYDGMSPEEAIADLKTRVKKYEEQYETITDDSLSYIKVFNLSTKLLVNHIYGRMAKDIIPALMAWHIGTRPIFLCRPGQTISGILTDGEDYVSRNKVDPSDPRFLDMSGRTRRKSMRGDSLGPKGREFREELLDFMFEECTEFCVKRASIRDMAYTGTSISGLDNSGSHNYAGHEQTTSRDPFPLRILTSTMPRASDTVNWEDYDFHINQMSNLNPLDKGDFAGMELEEIEEAHPQWFEKLKQDPYGTRFPGGECYHDLIRRLTSVVIDVEQQVVPTLVVSHVSILQCLMAYFRNTSVCRCMSIEVPMHTVVKFTPVRGGGWSESTHPLYDHPSPDHMVPAAPESESSTLTNGNNSFISHGSPIWGDSVPKVRSTLNRQQTS